NAKSVFEFSKKKVAEAYVKASEKLSEVSNAGADGGGGRPSGGDFWKGRFDDEDAKRAGDGGGAGAGKDFWADKWEKKEYEPYTDSSSDDDDDLVNRKNAGGQRPTSGLPRRPEPPSEARRREETDSSSDESLVDHRKVRMGFNVMDDDSSFSSSPARVHADTPPPRPSPPKPAPVTLASPQQQAESERHREAGNDKFKAGQFAEAEQFYTLAINALPSGDWGLIPVYNNRAAARLKTGEYGGAVEDCDASQRLNADDVKSLVRRAAAYEAMEKWEAARMDYEALMRRDPTIKGVSQGLARARKALAPQTTQPAKQQQQRPAPAPVPARSELENLFQPVNAFAPQAASAFAAPRASSSSSSVAPDGEAVKKLRAQNQQAEAEDAQKIALTDGVEAKINRWKGGKENNLRALLSSLDMVLWEGNRVQVNLSELITAQQVKIKYMKAIAKVHPDKLKPDTTTEQKMIANNVFSSLNKAWDAFKVENNM
ncbi:hypothetical protein HK101_006509, partial [Irineochytrium annulatum]